MKGTKINRVSELTKARALLTSILVGRSQGLTEPILVLSAWL